MIRCHRLPKPQEAVQWINYGLYKNPRNPGKYTVEWAKYPKIDLCLIRVDGDLKHTVAWGRRGPNTWTIGEDFWCASRWSHAKQWCFGFAQHAVASKWGNQSFTASLDPTNPIDQQIIKEQGWKLREDKSQLGSIVRPPTFTKRFSHNLNSK